MSDEKETKTVNLDELLTSAMAKVMPIITPFIKKFQADMEWQKKALIEIHKQIEELQKRGN